MLPPPLLPPPYPPLHSRTYMTKRKCEGRYDMAPLAAVSDDSKEFITKCLLVDQVTS